MPRRRTRFARRFRRVFFEAFESRCVLSSLSFAAPLTRSDSGAAYAIGHGDFNEDGIPDLATGNYGTNSLNVMVGNGDGTYRDAVVYSVGGLPSSVAVGDVDGDGNLDLATGTYTGQTLVVLFGNGDGTFGDLHSWSNSFEPVDVAIADMNNDGRNDLVASNYWNPGGTVTVLLRNTGRSFQAPVNYTAGSGANGLAVGDFDGDGDRDVATADYHAGTMSVLLNNGSGTLTGPTAYASGSLPTWIISADLNRDGRLDLAVSNQGSADISVFLGNGDGTFLAAVRYAAGAGDRVLRAADFNGDGLLDLAVSLTDTSQVAVLLGTGTGSFEAPTTFATGVEPYGLTAADFDGSGTVDIATANYTGSSVTVLLNAATPSNHAPSDISLTSASLPENQPSGTTIGMLSTSDLDLGDTFTYSLVSGEGDDNNASFTIVGDELRSAVEFDYEARNPSEYSVFIRTTDHGGLYFDKAFTITVTNVIEPPTPSAGGPYEITYGGSVTLHASGSFSPDGATLSYSWTVNGQAGVASGEQPGLSWAELAALGLSGGHEYAVSVTVDDGQGFVVTSEDVMLTVNKAEAIIVVQGYSDVYDGEAHGATGFATGVFGEELGGLSLGSGFTDVPGGMVNWTFTDETGNYNDEHGNVEIAIAQAGSTTIVVAEDGTYDGLPHAATASVSGVGGLSQELTVMYEGISGTSYPATTIAPTSAGTYRASAGYAGDINHLPSSDYKDFQVAPKALDASGSTQNTINISKAKVLTFLLTDVTGIVWGDGTVYDLFNGATFQLRVNGNDYSVTSTAAVLSDGTISISWQMTQELYDDLHEALNGANPSDRTLVDFFVSGTSNDGNYMLTEDIFARIFEKGKVVFE